MSDPRNNEESDQDLPELSEDDILEDDDEETEDDEFPPLIDTPAAAQAPHLPGFSDPPLGDASSGPITSTAPGDEVPLPLQGTAEATSGKNAENGSRAPDARAEEEEEGKLRIMKLENGGALLEVKAEVGAEAEAEGGDVRLGDNALGEGVVKKEEGLNQSNPPSPNFLEGGDTGSEEEQSAFMKELERFHKERSLEFKPPKFYGEGLNCLKLWRAVARLGGYELVTSCKLWRQVGESFRPPKTCTTVSWTFRIFYEKALLEYEKHKVRTGELQVPMPSLSESMSDKKIGGNQLPGSGRARRDAAARAMQGWHAQRYPGNGEIGDPIIKDKNPASPLKRDKHHKSIGGLKRKKASSLDRVAKVARTKSIKTQEDSVVVDIGEPADWVKINVRRIKDCFEIYALVPGLLREEVHVQSDPCGRLIISGDPEQPDNPWGVTPFKKVITLTSRIDPHQTSAVVTLHGQLFVRAPFEQSDL